MLMIPVLDGAYFHPFFRFERIGTLGIGSLLIALALATEASSISTLILRKEPDASNASLVIAASALVLMVLIWLPKRYLAKALDSSVMQGEATCSLSCIQITCVLFVGSLIYKVWKRGWWVDSATSMVLGLLFVWEGVKMVRWARSSEFGGGCCPADCVSRVETGDAELGHVYRDICECCQEKVECRNSDECKCLGTASVGEVQRVSGFLFYPDAPNGYTLRTAVLLSVQVVINAAPGRSFRPVGLYQDLPPTRTRHRKHEGILLLLSLLLPQRV